MVFRQEMELFLRARFTIISVVTHEEGRFWRAPATLRGREAHALDLGSGGRVLCRANPPPVCPEAAIPRPWRPSTAPMRPGIRSSC